MIKCPLCKDTQSTVSEILPSSDIVFLYKKQLAIDISRILDHITELSYHRCPQCGLNFFNPLICGDAVFYTHLQKFDWYYLTEKFEFDILKNHLGATDRILEIGCGRGALMRQLPHPKNYHGLDINLPAEFASNPQFFSHTIEQHAALYPQTYDTVCSFHVLEHIPKVYSFLSHAVRCLKKNGQLMLSVPSQDSFVGSAVNNPLNLPPHHLTRWNDRALSSIASLFGLKLVSLNREPLPDYHRIWAAKVIVCKQIQRFLKVKVRLIDHTIPHLAVSFLAKQIASIFHKPILLHARPYGQAVCAVFIKK